MGSGTGGGGGNFFEHPLAFTEPLFGPIGDFFNPDLPDVPTIPAPPVPEAPEISPADRLRQQAARRGSRGLGRRSTVLTAPSDRTVLGSSEFTRKTLVGT